MDEKVRISPFRQRIGSAAVKAKLRDSQRSEFGSWRQPVGQFRRAAGVHVRFRLTRPTSAKHQDTVRSEEEHAAAAAGLSSSYRGYRPLSSRHKLVTSWDQKEIPSAATPPQPRRPIITAARGKED